MNLHWLLPIESTDPLRLGKSIIASIRLRAALAGEHLESRGWSFASGDAPRSAVSVVVVGKIGVDCQGGRDRLWLDAVAKAKSSGARIVLDYTDHHLAVNGPMTGFYQTVLSMVDEAVVPSDHMKGLLRPLWSGSVSVIPDPVEIQVSPARAMSGADRRILWFGHSSNVPFLVDFLQSHDFTRYPFELHALSNEAGLPHIRHAMTSKRVGGSIGVWTVTHMLKWAAACHACIIPSDPENPKKSGASSNRLITSLALGLPTAADPLPSYREFSPYFVNLRSTAFAELLKDPGGHQRAVEQAQRDIVPLFSKDRVGLAWSDLFERLVA